MPESTYLKRTKKAKFKKVYDNNTYVENVLEEIFTIDEEKALNDITFWEKIVFELSMQNEQLLSFNIDPFSVLNDLTQDKKDMLLKMYAYRNKAGKELNSKK